MKAAVAVASAFFIAMAMLCLGAVSFLFGGDAAATCTGTGTMPGGPAPSVQPSLNTPPHIHTASATWQTDQVHNAATIINVGIATGVPVRGWIVALTAAMQESSLTNLPDLGDANNSDSLGLFQERPSQGWGTPAQIMDPTYSSTAFYKHLLAISGWQTMTVAQTAQAVERSAYGERYGTWETDASQLMAAITGLGNPSATAPLVCAGGGSGGPVALPSGYSLPAGTPQSVATAIMWALAQLGTPYSFGGDCTAPHSGQAARQCDCSSLVQIAYKAAGIVLPRTSQEQFHAGVPVPGPNQLQPGDLIFVPGAHPGTKDAPGHVGMYLGAGLVVDAPQTGDVVHITHLAPYWLGNLAGIRRIG